jgi:hypothetical protein
LAHSLAILRAGLAGEKRRIIRPRILIRSCRSRCDRRVHASRARTSEANVVRLPGAPFTIDEGDVRNGFEVHLVNKLGKHEALT